MTRHPPSVSWVVVGAVVAFAALLNVLPSSPDMQWITESAQLLLALVASTVCGIAAARESGEGRAFWVGLSAAVAVWAAGQARYMWSVDWTATEADFLEDVLFLSVSLPLLPALVLRPDRVRADRFRLAVDVAVAVLLAAFVFLYVGLSFPDTGRGTTYDRWRIGAGWLQACVLTGAFAWRWHTADPPWRGLLGRLGLAYAGWGLGGAVVTMLLFSGTYRAGLRDLPWLLPFAWIALEAARWRPTTGHAGSDWAEGWSSTRRGHALALVAIAVPPLTHFTTTLTRGGPPAAWAGQTWVAAIALTGVTALFVIRQLSALTALEQAERRRRERRRASEERFAKAFHALPVGAAITTWDTDRFVDINARGQELLGLRTADLEHVVSRDLWVDADAMFSARQALETGPVLEREITLRRGTGGIVEVRASFQVIEIAGQRCVLTLVEDHRLKQRLEAQLAQMRKTEAVGRLAGAVAHDFNNLLTAILGGAELAHDKIDEPDALRRDLHHVLAAATRGSALTRQLLAYGRGEGEIPETLDVGTAIRDAHRTLLHLVGDDIVMDIDLPDSPLYVRIDASRFDQILINLVVNARDAMPQGGRLRIVVRRVPLGADDAARVQVAAGDYIRLSIGDTGEGMSDEVKRKVFEPFFTTKAPGKGSGLGLATVLGAVRQAGGAIDVESEPSRGTTVHVFLPAWTGEWAPVQPERPPTIAAQSPTETILLVEDEPAVRELVKTVLERGGYRVIEASSGPDALAMVEHWTDRIDLLLTDVIMPGMNGRQLAERLLAVRPGLRVLYASGYTADALGPLGMLNNPVELIQKPFTPNALLERVRRMLDASSEP